MCNGSYLDDAFYTEVNIFSILKIQLALEALLQRKYSRLTNRMLSKDNQSIASSLESDQNLHQDYLRLRGNIHVQVALFECFSHPKKSASFLVCHHNLPSIPRQNNFPRQCLFQHLVRKFLSSFLANGA